MDASNSLDRIAQIISNLHYKDWSFKVGQDGGGRAYLQMRFRAPCAVTGKDMVQACRKWWLSPHMTETELVSTAMKAVLAGEEHEAKENFRYKGKALFNPHISVAALLESCDQYEVRA